jgi:hypothetical protein
MPPISGASQNIQSWATAHPPSISAGPVLRAGFTAQLVTGIPTKWIKVRPNPIAIGAKPAGAFPWVEPMMMKRNIMVKINSQRNAAKALYLPGECSPKPFAANP